jgi:DNA-binding CsgD family transcriptional regulator/PAS domain-containing protein
MHAPQVLTAIYDAAIDDGAWARLPGVLTQAIGGESASLWFGSASGPVVSAYNHEPLKHRMYAEYYRFVDPWMEAVRERSLFSAVHRSSDLISYRELQKTEFYSDFMLATRTGPVLGSTLKIGAKVCALAVYRSTGDSDYSDGQKHRLEQFLPHVGQAVRLRAKFQKEQLSTRLAKDVLKALRSALVVCDQRGIVVYANDAAERLAASEKHFSLGTSGTPIFVRGHEQGGALHALIFDAAQGGQGGALRVDTLGGPRLFLTISPLLGEQQQQTPGRALVTIRSEDKYDLLSPACLRGMFGLTIAEAEIALGLLANQSLSQIQARRRVSENTIRSQLARILAKTGTANQRELVRLVTSLSQP